MRPTRTLGVLAPTLLLCLVGCDDPGTRPADWETIHTEIIVPSCATSSCHNSVARTAGVVLDDVDDAYNFLIDNFIVTPGAVDSLLMLRIEGNIPGLALMPPDAPLPKADVDLIRTWIKEGAQR